VSGRIKHRGGLVFVPVATTFSFLGIYSFFVFCQGFSHFWEFTVFLFFARVDARVKSQNSADESSLLPG